MRYICRLDIGLYSCVAPDIATDEVIITDERIQHIKERHPGVYESFGDYIGEMIISPDYIMQDEHESTALVMKEFADARRGGCFRLALRLAVRSDTEGLKNSVITFMRVRQKEYRRFVRNKKNLYKRE